MKIKLVDLVMLLSKCVKTINNESLYPRPMYYVDALDE